MLDNLATTASPEGLSVFGDNPRLAMSSDLQLGLAKECTAFSQIELHRNSLWSSIFSEVHTPIPCQEEQKRFFMDHFIRPQLDALSHNCKSGALVAAVMPLLMLGENKEALSLLLSHKYDANDYWYNHTHAVALKLTGKMADAKRLLQELGNVCPHDYRPWHALGRIHIQNKEWDQAKAVFTKAIEVATKQDAEEPLLFNDYATAEIANQRINEAIGLLRTALSYDNRCAFALNNLGVCYRRLNNLARARRYFLEAMRIDRRCVPALHNLAECDFEEKKYHSAVKLLEQHLTIMPADLQAKERLSWAYYQLGQVGQAASLLSEMIKQNGDEPAALNNLAMIYLKQGKKHKAEESFLRAIELDQVSAQIRFNYASFLSELERWNDVVNILFHSQGIETHIDSIVLLAHGLLHAVGPDRAEDLLLQHRDKFKLDARLPSLLSYILASEKDEPEKAITLLRQARQWHPNDLVIINNLAYSYLKFNKTAEARELLAPVVRPDTIPDSTSTIFLMASWGLLRLQEGDIKEGLRCYELARTRADGQLKTAIEQKMLLEQGKYHMRTGESKTALAMLKQSQKLGVNGEFTREAHRLIQAGASLN